MLTVAVIPFEGALLVDFVQAQRVVPVRDATPLESTKAAPDPVPGPEGTQSVPGTPLRGRRRRHEWVDGADQTLAPGLIVEWRRSPANGWEALLATPGGRGGGVLVHWRGAGAMRPLSDDGWLPQH